ncbi:hypothetical protein L226DRAFT_529919 [Lentinus tigrinus ALCF2SS1-7]|uniref:Uncharacterized protein n=1 Tax=Lentinus tigrinus ALCF2SS1-6 TaxID=1328759 RepID=A0A5C2SQ51_9APHY|nr:hypothetical protein L227DRAFT_569728 [Lentinus tigrinus ALCF2SS1-6]RPD79708.1 hypothetical protein L226DRAFT_529919 [Lentinus tigrinus ALCF2SS1-7]
MSTFTPSDAVNHSNERDWPAQLGMLDWDSTNIVFTKRSLLEFLKYVGVTVDPNFTNIQKLPRYAQFGKLSGGTDIGQSSAAAPTTASSPSVPASDFKPTRRVREPPGGSHSNIFQYGGDDESDALAAAPSKSSQEPPTAVSVPASTEESKTQSEETNYQPKSKRTTSGVAGLWDPADETEVFIPTRRVREMPGGKDSISGLF